MTILTDRFAKAVDYARIAHASQVRKGSNIPYVYHPLAVATLIIEFGGNEDQAIAGLLHDVVEDCGAGHAQLINAQFGGEVARMVEGCTDGTAESKASHLTPKDKWHHWMRRKLAYAAHLAEALPDTLLVSACDKLHNARAIVQDLESGEAVFERFTGGCEGTLAYYTSLAQIFSDRGIAPSGQLQRVTKTMLALAGVESSVTLDKLASLKGIPPYKRQLQNLLDTGEMVEDNDGHSMGFSPIAGD